MSSDFHFLVPESFKQNLVQIGTEVSEKIHFEFLYPHTLGQGQEITLNFNTHIFCIYSITRCVRKVKGQGRHFVTFQSSCLIF